MQYYNYLLKTKRALVCVNAKFGQTVLEEVINEILIHYPKTSRSRVIILQLLSPFMTAGGNLSITKPISTTCPSGNTTEILKFEEQWQKSKPFEDIPTLTPLKLIRYFMPGSKYSKMDPGQLLMSFRQDLGNICKIDGFLGRPNAVITHNPQDFETLVRNEGIWPTRPGADGIEYHRRVHRANFFEGVEGILGT